VRAFGSISNQSAMVAGVDLVHCLAVFRIDVPTLSRILPKKGLSSWWRPLSPHLLRLSPERNVFVQAPSWNSFDSNHGACKKLLSVRSSCHLDGGPRPRYIISAPHLFRIADNRDISLHQVLGRWTRHISSWLDTNLWNNWNRRCPFSHFLPAFESMKCCGDSAPSSLFSRF